MSTLLLDGKISQRLKVLGVMDYWFIKVNIKWLSLNYFSVSYLGHAVLCWPHELYTNTKYLTSSGSFFTPR